ncbi:LysR family transcriptional regulator [Nocardia sp. AG03]|uniref:LysR family transcriptional regulator n=1 Tax=Nocardia sp. AG03 TaxID=3025312 RepID=UPI002418722F|nr:LysR family transcriptional regulator [Nocardia sp. AG03]
MDLDLPTVRAFVLAAEQRHFGRAAEALGITQQAVSKRVARLEADLGVRLLARDHHGARLTEDGARFLPAAREALAAADRAVSILRAERRPLRLDVWGHLYAPLRTLAPLADDPDAPALRPGHGRDLPEVAAALARGDIDAGFGRVHPPLPAGLTHRLIRLEPVDVLLGPDHPLATATALRPDQLRDSVLHTPATLDRLDFLARFAERFGITEHRTAPNLGAAPLLSGLVSDPRGVLVHPADAGFPEVPGVRAVPLIEPTPLYAWSLLWRSGSEPPALAGLLAALVRLAGARRWLEYDPARDWLPSEHLP